MTSTDSQRSAPAKPHDRVDDHVGDQERKSERANDSHLNSDSDSDPDSHPQGRVLVVDDSRFICRLLASYVESSGEFKVIGQAHTGAEAIALLRELHPDIVTLDIEMPDRNGLETLHEIMRIHPLPVIMFSGVSKQAANITLNALKSGAADFVLKYEPGIDNDPNLLRLELLAKIRIALQPRASSFPPDNPATETEPAIPEPEPEPRPTEPPPSDKKAQYSPANTHEHATASASTKTTDPLTRLHDEVTTHNQNNISPEATTPPAEDDLGAMLKARSEDIIIRAPRYEDAEAKRNRLNRLADHLIIIGASQGGALPIRELLTELPGDLPAGVIVILHMVETFTSVLAAHFDRHVRLSVKEAENGDRLYNGQVLIAPGDYHLLLGSDRRVELNQGPKYLGLRPSIDVTMQSIAQIYRDRTTGVLLSGIGEDGVEGLAFIQSKYGKCYVQDAASCVVQGAPQTAIEKGVANYVETPTRIGQLIRLALMP